MQNILVIGNKIFTYDIKVILSNLSERVTAVHDIAEVRQALRDKSLGVVIFDRESYGHKGARSCLKITGLIKRSGKPFIVVSSERSVKSVVAAKRSGAVDFITKPFHNREFITRVGAVLSGKCRISCIGGGTGLLNLLLGLKTLPNTLLTSIVNMSDDGGSSGRLMASFGVLPPGDIRRSLVALSNAPELMNEIMRYRFSKGKGLVGHSFGNLLLTALADITGSMSEAVKELGDLLYIQGIVIPITTQKSTLCAMFEDRSVIKSEYRIDVADGRDPELKIKRLWHEPEAECNIDAYSAIINSDVLIIGPGDLYTSVIANLTVKHIKEAIISSAAKKVYICNLMTKPGETANYDAIQHVKEIVKHLAGDHLDYVIISNTKLSGDAILKYLKKDQSPVEAGDIRKIRECSGADVIMSDVSHETELVRHDGEKLKTVIEKIISLE